MLDIIFGLTNSTEKHPVCIRFISHTPGGVVLAADRWFFSKENTRALKESVMPAKRDGFFCKATDVNEYGFSAAANGDKVREGETRMILAVRGDEHNAFMKHKEGKLSEKGAEEKRERMGRMAIMSGADIPQEEAHPMHKQGIPQRKHVNAGSGCLPALRQRLGVRTHLVAFLPVYITAKLESVIGRADLLSKYSPEGAVVKCSKAYAAEKETGEIGRSIPKKPEEPGKKPGLNIFPILRI